MKKRKYILVLSGGGGKGAFQVGALDYIFKHGFYHGEEHVPGNKVKFNYIAGISAGSLNAVMVAMNKFEELKHLWLNEIAGNPEKIWTSDFVEATEGGIVKPKEGVLQKVLPKIGLFKGLGLMLSKKKQKRLGREVLDKITAIESFASNTPLKERLDDLVDIELIQNTLLRVGYVSLDSGQYHTVKHTDFSKNNAQFKKAILASTAMPVVWEPIDEVLSKGPNNTINSHKNLVDGGIRNVSPLGDIIKDINANNEPDTEYFVIIINNHSGALQPFQKERQNFLNVAYRSLVDITLNEIFINDIREFTRINNLVHQLEMAREGGLPTTFELRNPSNQQVFRKFYYEIIQPDEPIGTTLDFGKQQIDSRFDHGYKIAEKVFGPPAAEANGTLLADGQFQPQPLFGGLDVAISPAPRKTTWQV